ncbi:MAG: carbohydrate kinase family protein [Rhodobacteraceae bacterium]|nr:carbohydrate kinase family protein [Paracoccaceae bacterium]
MSPPLDLVAAGRIYCDLVFAGLDAPPAPGREVYAGSLTIAGGGGAFITAAYAAALGLAAGLAGILPAPPFDAAVRGEAAALGIRSHCAPAPAGSDPQITAAIVTGGDRAFVTRRPGAALAEPLALPPARHLHVGELATLLDHPRLLALARAAGMTVSLDCSWDGAAFARPGVAEAIAAVDLFLPNEGEAARLLALGIALEPRVATVVKRGPAGARALPRGAPAVEVAAAPAAAVDPTGAGDAFNAGLIAAWLDGAPVAAALALGVACGAVAVARPGGATALPCLAHLRPPAARTALP